MVNIHKYNKMKEQTREALANLNHIGPDFRKSRKMNNNSGGNYDSGSSNTNNHILKGGSSNLSAYGGQGGVINCEVIWNNKLDPIDANFKIETN